MNAEGKRALVRCLVPFLCALVAFCLLGLDVMRPAVAGGCIAPRDPGDGGGAPPPPPAPPPGEGPPPSEDPPPSDPPTTDDEDPPPPEETTPDEEPRPPTTPPEPPPPPTRVPAPSAPAPVTAAPTPRASGTGARRAPPTTPAHVMSTWRGWWAVNDRALLPERAGDPGGTTPHPDDEAFAEGRRARRELAVTQEILPALRRILAPDAKGSDLLRRTGLLALGKVARTEADSALLVHWLRNARAAEPVRDAAALGIGLLRRSDRARQLDARILDALRGQLARVVDDASAPDAVRATSAISVGLLGDQPFGAGIHAEGRLVTQRTWRSLKVTHARADLPVALLTALGMQPAAGVPDGVREALRDVVFGRPVLERTWSDMERSHALTALVRLGGPEALTTPLRVLQGRRMPNEVRRAAYIAVGRTAGALSSDERHEVAGVVRPSLRRIRDPLTRGLAHVAIGRLAAAQLASGRPLVRDLRTLWRHLLTEARTGTVAARGFAVLGVGLAARGDGSSSPWARGAREEAERLLLAGLQSDRGDDDLRGAHAIALGVMKATSAVPELVACVEGQDETDRLRRDAAVGLGQIGYRGREVVRALNVALSERRRPQVQAGAALALSLLRGPGATRRLLRELEHAPTATDVLRLTEPLGYLGDPALAHPLIEYAVSPRHGDYPRAFMVVALGNIGDPEPRPSLAWLGEDANYPAAPPALRDALFTR